MKNRFFVVSSLVFLFASGSFAQLAPIAGQPAAKKEPKVMVLPPEAFTVPSNHLAIVNLNHAVDAAWLEKQAKYMRSQLHVQVVVREKAVPEKELCDLRTLIARLKAEDKDAPLQLFIGKGASLPSVLAEPYAGWGFMDAGWVEQGGGTQELILDRMGKRLFQTLGHVIGAGFRMEREAVMRFTPSPAALDDCISHGFHPLNSGIFSVYANGIGLETIRLRPISELRAMGILKSRNPRKPEAEEPGKPAESDSAATE